MTTPKKRHLNIQPITTQGSAYIPKSNLNSRTGTIKDIAYRIMSQDSYPERNLKDVATAVLESITNAPYYNDYSGSFLRGKHTPDLNRDLNHLILYGNTKNQFKRKKLRGFNYSNFLQKNYGVKSVPTYEGQIILANQMTVPKEYKPLIEYMADNPNIHYYTSDEDSYENKDFIENEIRPFKSVDDVASYRRSFRRNSKGEAELAAQDLIDYGAGYANNYGIIAGLQGALLSKVINSPVILDQGLAVKYSDNPNDFKYDDSWYNTLQKLVNNNKILQKNEDGSYTYPLMLPDVEVSKKYSKRSLRDGRNKKRYGGIYIAPSKRGTFTAAATKHGMGVQEFASRVLSNKDNYSPAMVKKANFARNASKWK